MWKFSFMLCRMAKRIVLPSKLMHGSRTVPLGQSTSVVVLPVAASSTFIAPPGGWLPSVASPTCESVSMAW